LSNYNLADVSMPYGHMVASGSTRVLSVEAEWQGEQVAHRCFAIGQETRKL
jgi:hypothetical protein